MSVSHCGTSVIRYRTKGDSVPPKYPYRSAIIEVDRLPSTVLVGRATSVDRAQRPHFDVQDLGPSTARKPRLATTTRGLASVGSKTAEVDAPRSNLLGLAAARLG